MGKVAGGVRSCHKNTELDRHKHREALSPALTQTILKDLSGSNVTVKSLY